MIKILLLYILFVCYSASTVGKIIIIDVQNGTDSPHCLNGLVPCKSLEFVAKNGINNTIFEITSPLVNVTTRIIFCRFQNVTIRGVGAKNTTLTCADNDNNGSIEFHKSTGITLSQLSITGCGTAFDMPLSKAKVSTALYFNECHHVNVKQVNFKDNNGFGVHFMKSTNLNVGESHFYSNYYQPKKDSRHLTVGGGMFVYHNERQSESYFIKISSVTFDSNSANTMKIASFNFAKIGGGLKLQLGYQANTAVSISDCSFINNTGVSGGGAHLFIFSSAKNNNITFDNCNFTNNNASVYSGGGLDMFISTKEKSRPLANQIILTRCHFSNNRAKYGGGVSIYSPRSPCIEKVHHNIINFTESVFIRNVANTSAAVDINRRTEKSYGDTFLTTVAFNNCQFRNNKALGSPLNENYKYTAFRVMFTVDISLTFSGNKTLFENNTGTALYIASTTVTFTSGSVTKFTNNTGDRGGAMLLTENGVLNVGSKAQLWFTNNTASLGGAICIIPNIFYHYKTCFIQRPSCYKKKKNCEDSTARYIFRDNTATIGFGHDFFASTFSNCKENTNGSLINFFIGKKMGLFNFSRPLNESIATAVSSIELQDKELQAYPGIPQNITIIQHDDFKNIITKSFSLYAHLEHINGHVTIKQEYRTLSTNKIVFEGTENSSASLILETSGLSNSAKMIKVDSPSVSSRIHIL